jgi:hypothetical protein
MDGVPIPGIVIALAVAFVVGVRQALRSAAERRRLRGELTTRPVLDQGAEGDVVRLTGIVHPIELLSAPLSGRPCVMYRSRVDNASPFGPKKWDYRLATSITSFYLHREDGARVLVLGQAIVELPAVRIVDRGRKQQFLLAQGVSVRDRGWPRFEEVIIEPGAQISVVGTKMLAEVDPASAVERGFREPGPATIRLTGDPAHPLIIGPAPARASRGA